MIAIKDTFYSRMFALAGLWNVCIGLTGLVFADFSVALFFGRTAVTGDFLGGLSFRLFMVAIITFGIGYCLVSRDLGLNRGIVSLGLACKMILFVMFTYYYFTAGLRYGCADGGGDLAWSVLLWYSCSDQGQCEA